MAHSKEGDGGTGWYWVVLGGLSSLISRQTGREEKSYSLMWFSGADSQVKSKGILFSEVQSNVAVVLSVCTIKPYQHISVFPL